MQGRWAQVITSQGMPVIAAAYITNAASDEEPEASNEAKPATQCSYMLPRIHQKCGLTINTERSRHAASDAGMRRQRQRRHRRECCYSRHAIQQAPEMRAHTKARAEHAALRDLV